MSKKIKIGISVGDINGIGMEVIIKTFMDSRMMDVCSPVIYGSTHLASSHRKSLGINDFSFHPIKNIREINNKKANLIDCWQEEIDISFGQSTETGGKYALYP